MTNELKNHYGENVSWFCFEASVGLPEFKDKVKGYIPADIDVYGEGDNGCDCCGSVNISNLLESAHVVLDEQSAELKQLRKERDELTLWLRVFRWSVLSMIVLL